MGQTSNIVIRNNLFADIGGTTGSSAPGRLFQLVNGIINITIDHNTALDQGLIVLADSKPTDGLVFQDNIVAAGLYGVIGSGTAEGTSTLDTYFPGYVFQHNVVVGGTSSRYPAGNYFLPDLAGVGFQDYAGGNLKLGPSSPFSATATGGLAIGADFAGLTPVFGMAVAGGRRAPAFVLSPRRH
jgi:hypothetical protein